MTSGLGSISLDPEHAARASRLQLLDRGARPRRRARACPARPRRARAARSGRTCAPPRAGAATPFWRVMRPTKTTDRLRPGRCRGARARRCPGRARTRRCRSRCRSRGRGRGRSPDRRARMSPRMPLRDRDHRVGVLQRRPLAEARQRVAAAELLRLPRPQRLERVHGGDVRDAVHELGQVAAEVRVPGVAVDEVGAARRRRPSSGRSTSRAARRARARRRPARPTPRGRWRRRGRRPSACTVDVVERAQLAREVLDVHARPAVDLRRVLAREQRDLHAVDRRCPWG